MPQISNFVKKSKLLSFIKSKIGLPRMMGVLVVFIILLFAISSYLVLNSKQQNNERTEMIPSPTLSVSTFPSPTQSSTPTATATSLSPTKRLISPTSSTTSLHVRLSDNGSAVTDSSLELTVRNNNTGQEQKMRNTNSSWTLSNISSGRYKVSVTYPNDRFVNTERKCDGCQNKQDISNYGICGYMTDINTGNNINIFCELRSTKPLVTQPQATPQDSTPPTTNIYYPQPNGSITYKIDGKVCAIANAPSDNYSNSNEIETEYKFDNGSWSGYATGRGYLCIDSLANGSHSLSYHSKDKAGNVESTKILEFTVNIEGN